MTMTRWASFAALVLISVVGFFLPLPALAESISVTAVVAEVGTTPPPNPIVEFTGVAAPNATMVIIRNGTQITSGVAGSSANFTFLLTDQPVGQQIYELRATDIDGRALSPMTFALNLAAGSTTSLVGIFLGPSISLDQSAVTVGAAVIVSGQTYPGSTVTLTISTTPVKNSIVTTNSQGRWQDVIATTEIGVGNFTIYAQATSSIVGTSEISASVNLVIAVAPTSTNTNTPQNTNVTPPQNTNTSPPPVDPFAGKATADLNGDGRVNLIDLSILLFYWQLGKPSNTRTDINSDGLVGMSDFSIMLFQWTG